MEKTAGNGSHKNISYSSSPILLLGLLSGKHGLMYMQFQSGSRETPTCVFLKDLAYGDEGVDVMAMQMFLQSQGTFPAAVPTTGKFLNITLDAVKKFQVKYKYLSHD